MAKGPKNRSLQDDELVALAAASESKKQQGGESNELNPLQQRILSILDKKAQDEEDAVEKEKEAHLQRVKQHEANESQIRLKRQMHSHLKEDGKTQFAGQQHSDARYAFICQGCGVTMWYPANEGEEEMPQHLLPKGDFIGSSAVGLQRM